MADEDAANGLRFDDPRLGFMGHGAVSVNAVSDPSSLTNDDVSAAFLDPAAAWDLDASPPDDSYDLSTASTTTTVPSAQPGYVSPVWQAPTFDQQHHFGLPNIDPTSVFGSGPEATERGTALPPSKPPLRSVTTLTPALQEKLRNIAMPPHLQYGSPKSASSPESAKSGTGSGSSPDASSASQKDSRKRKVSDDLDDDDLTEESGKPVKKTAHNMIEKRYRTNINDKIAALRDSVPSLRIMCKSARGEDTTEDREELHGLTPAHKLNKATVLSKATEYIRHLEKRNNRLLEENGAMQARIAAFEKLFMAGAMNGSMPPMQQQPTPMQYPQDNQQQQLAPSPLETPQDVMPAGMIDVPDDMKRIISAQMAVGQPYPVPQQPFRYPPLIRQQQIQQHPQDPPSSWSSASPYLGKLMVGSLAGLMIMEAVRESESSNEEPQGRGLFALPVQLLGRLPSSANIHIMGYHAHVSIKFLLLLGVVLWAFIPSLFASSGAKPKKQQAAALHPAPSLASPIHVRRRAWLTSVQTVWVPHHNFFLEAAALILKTLKLSLRNAFGDHAYQVLTGVTPEQEAARVKAWSIALDSQLAGGDMEICKSRLVLTLLASGTLPDTPIRLMLKALHVRVLLWDLGQNRLQLGTVNAIATKIARSRWNEARQLNQLLDQLGRSSSTQHEDELPDHLAALVERECDEVLSDVVIQRAHNLAFNMETTHNIVSPIDGTDAVVDDAAIGSPMDAVAAWWSMELLHDILTSTLDEDEGALVNRAERIELALRVAPIGSLAQTRATLARAVLVDKARGANIAAALQALRANSSDSLVVNSMSLINASSHPLVGPIAIANPSSPTSNRDLRLSLRSAMALAHLKRLDGDAPGSSKEVVRRLIETVLMLCTTAPMSLLGFTSVMELMEQVLENKNTSETFAPLLERLAANLRLWMGGPLGSKCGVRTDVQHKVIGRCLAITKHLVGMDQDTGYESLSEGEDEER